jgi:MFS family permease
MCFGIALGSFVSYSFSAWQTKYLLLLDPDFNFQNLLLILGVINGTTYAGGTFLGARLADSWGAKNIRAYGWLPAIAISLCLPIGIVSFWVPSVESHLILTTVFLLFMGMYLGPSFAIAQTLAPINQRAMSTALFFFILNLIALGGGPTITGWMIDLFKDTSADLESTRYALTVTCLVFVPSILSFLVVARKIPKDWASAEERNLELIQSD